MCIILDFSLLSKYFWHFSVDLTDQQRAAQANSLKWSSRRNCILLLLYKFDGISWTQVSLLSFLSSCFWTALLHPCREMTWFIKPQPCRCFPSLLKVIQKIPALWGGPGGFSLLLDEHERSQRFHSSSAWMLTGTFVALRPLRDYKNCCHKHFVPIKCGGGKRKKSCCDSEMKLHIPPHWKSES